MYQVLNCLVTEHDWRLVVLGGAICWLSSAVAISLFHRAKVSQGRTRAIWIGLDAAVGGCGIWATHFVAMLAYDPGTGAGYNIPVTLLSLVFAIAIAAAGISIALLNDRRSTHAIGGAVVGVGVAAMHYTGMMALEIPAHIVWSPGIVLASVVFGSVFAALALVVAARRDDRGHTVAATALLTVAIVSHHFTAMGAITLVPDPTLVGDELSISPAALSFLTAVAAFAILGISFVAAMLDRRSSGELHQQKVLLDTAIGNMSQGLCMFDAEGRILLFNERYQRDDGSDRNAATRPPVDRRSPGSEVDRKMGRRSRRVLHHGGGRGERRRKPDPGRRPQRTFDPRGRSADERRRLGRDIRGHHRMAAGAGADFAYGAPRRADQSAEPDAVPRAA